MIICIEIFPHVKPFPRRWHGCSEAELLTVTTEAAVAAAAAAASATAALSFPAKRCYRTFAVRLIIDKSSS